MAGAATFEFGRAICIEGGLVDVGCVRNERIGDGKWGGGSGKYIVVGVG